MPWFPDLVAPLRSERVTLRFGSERDIPEILIAHQDDPELYLRLGLVRPPSGAQLGSREEAEPAERAAGRGVRFTILEPLSDRCRGQIDVHHVEWDHQRAELGIWLAPAFRGHGLAPDALRLAAGWLFGTCGLLRVEMFTETDNAAMVAAAERAGFRREGVLRALARERGQRIDLIVLSLLPSDVAQPAPAGQEQA